MERRSEKRYPVIKSFVYSDCAHLGHSELMTAMAANVSKSGACLYTEKQYGKGAVLTICSKAFGGVLRDAVVCWSRKVSEGIFKVGVALN